MEILFTCFSKSEAGINNDVCNTSRPKLIDLLMKVVRYVFDQVVVSGLRYHRLGIAAHVHDNVGYLQGAYGIEHLWIKTATGYIVYNTSAFLYGDAGNLAPKGIDGK